MLLTRRLNFKLFARAHPPKTQLQLQQPLLQLFWPKTANCSLGLEIQYQRVPFGHNSCSKSFLEASSDFTLTFQHGLYSDRLFCNFNINFKDFAIWALEFNWRHLQEKDSYFHTIFSKCYKFSWLKYGRYPSYLYWSFTNSRQPSAT